jgi:hypothetical protein
VDDTGLPSSPTSAAGGGIGDSTSSNGLRPRWRATAAAVVVFVLVCEWLIPRLQTDRPDVGTVSTADYTWPALGLAVGALVVAVCVALVSLPGSLARDRRLLIGSAVAR